MTKITPKNFAELLLELTDTTELHNSKPILAEFVALVARKKMLGKSDEIIAEYEKLYNHKHGIIEAHIITSQNLATNTIHKLKEVLKEKHKAKEVNLSEKIDARLIGGMKIRVGDTVYDGTLRNTLNQLQAKLTA